MSTDTKLYQILNKIGQIVLLSILWTVCAMPVITMGAATSALYYCARKNIRRDEGAMLSDFWKSIKGDFRQSTLAMLLFAGFAVVIWAAVNGLVQIAGMAQDQAYFILLLFGVILVAWSHYVFSGIARFENTLGAILKNSLILAFMNLPKSLAMAFVLGAVLAGFILTLPRSTGAVLFLPGLYGLFFSFMMEPIYVKLIGKPETELEEEEQDEGLA